MVGGPFERGGVMQPYESYKPSGAEWLGDIPAHWTVTPAKRLFREVSEKNHPDAELLSVTQEFGVVPRDQLEQRVVMPTGQLQIFKLVRADDFVISLRSFQGGIEYSEFTGLVSPAYTILRKQKNANSRYLKHLLKSAPFISELNTSVTGIREGKNISFSEMAYSLLPLPAASEQARIADFLDVKTAEIDAAIAKKERLIELLDEQKSILINSLVMKGANPQALTKASGLSWGGDIPAHWKIRYLKHLFRETDARTSTGEEPLFSLRMSGQLLRHNDVSDKPITPDQLIGYKIVSPGQLVMNRMRASMGLFAVAHERGLVSPDYAVFNCIDDISQAYFLALFRNSAIRGVFLTESKGLGTGSSGFLRLYSDRFGGIKVPCPPREEQEKIVLAINDHFLKFADVERSVKIEIEKLVVMRSILIADAVTGKMRV